MMRHQDGSSAYIDVVSAIVADGRSVSPRGMPCLELTDVSVSIASAEAAVPLATSRSVRYAIGATEYCQLLAGVSCLAQLDAASGGRFSAYADHSMLLGAYGPRLHSQLPAAIGKMSDDNDTRQSVAVLWRRAGREYHDSPRDVPCTVCVIFRLRDGRLSLTAVMRSQDAWLGIPYDWWQFSRLQMTMAWALGVKPGEMTFFVSSLHLYERDLARAMRLEPRMMLPEMRVPPAITAGTEADGLTAVARLALASAAAESVILGDHTDAPGTEWHRQVISPLPPYHKMCHICRYVTEEHTGHLCPEVA